MSVPPSPCGISTIKYAERFRSQTLGDLNEELKIKAFELLKDDFQTYNLEVTPKKWDPTTICNGNFPLSELTREQRRGADA